MSDEDAATGEAPTPGDRPEPYDPAGLVERGIARLGRKESDRAIEDFDAAIRLDPSSYHAHVNRGRARLAQGQYAPAIRDFDDALRLEPEDANALGLRATARRLRGEYPEAIADYDRAIRRDPGLPWLFRGRGASLDSLEDYRAAIADYSRAIALDPEDAKAYRHRGRARYAEGEFEAAIDDLTRAIGIGPEDARDYLRRADARASVEDFDGAISDYGEALGLDPNLADAHRGRARSLEALGRVEDAEADHDRADELEEAAPMGEAGMPERKAQIDALIRSHFEPTSPEALTITERLFPHRVRADLQRAIDRILGGEATISFFCGVRKRHSFEGLSLTELLVRDRHDPAQAVPPLFEEIDIGGEEPVRCLKNGLWLLESEGARFVAFLEQHSHYGRMQRLRIQVASTNDPPGYRATQGFFRRLEEAVEKAESYRGKILSLEADEHYSGRSSGIRVHRLARVERDQVILPARTLELLERNVIRFVGLRPELDGLGLATKKGLLFYGPPGTGKTHTIHYLAGALPGHTTLLIAAEQVGLLDEYMTLARLLQPSVVVIEDVDLIARDRTTMGSPCEEVLLNKLLNEMDGLRADAEILFILTTNRPEALEAALASRPGRVDQAIEFPLPDEAGRAKLVRLYARGMEVPDGVLEATVRRTEGVSASFIKELLRRSVQFRLERDGSGPLEMGDVEAALDELLFSGGSLNRKLLGASAGGSDSSCSP